MVGRRGVNRWWAVGMSTLMALSLAAFTGGAAMAQDDCAPVEPAGPLPDLTAQLGHKPKVGLVMKSLANEFFQQMQAGAEAYAAENADVFDFEAVGMKDERDFAAQVSAVENYITQQFDVIVIAPADSKAMVEPIARALEAGIKVINIDVALDQQAMADAGLDLAFFGPDNRAGAKMAGDSLGQALGEGGKVVILEGNPEADNAVQRKLGFDDSVAEYKLDLLESTHGPLGDRRGRGDHLQLPHQVPRPAGHHGRQRLHGPGRHRRPGRRRQDR